MSVDILAQYIALCDDCSWETGFYLFEEDAEAAAQEHLDEGCWR